MHLFHGAFSFCNDAAALLVSPLARKSNQQIITQKL